VAGFLLHGFFGLFHNSFACVGGWFCVDFGALLKEPLELVCLIVLNVSLAYVQRGCPASEVTWSSVVFTVRIGHFQS